MNPPPTSLPITSLWVIPVHQPQASCIEPGVVICFLYNIIHVSMTFPQIIPLSPSLTGSKRLFYTSVSLLLSHMQGYHYHLSKFHIYALEWQPTPVVLPGESHGWRSLVGCSPWGRYKLDTTSLSLSCIGEGNGNPLQCSCLENPRNGGAWWAAVSGVTQSRTQLK